MDRTPLFQAAVKAVRLRLRAQRKDKNGSLNDSSILTKSIRKVTPFSSNAREIASRISKLQEFLLKHRKDYINSAGHLVSGGSGMSDKERDQIDCDAQQFIQICSEQITSLQQQVLEKPAARQAVAHRQVVYEALRDYLKSVCRLYSEQRAIRVKRIVDRKRISRLQPEGFKKLLSVSSVNPTRRSSSDSANSAGHSSSSSQQQQHSHTGSVEDKDEQEDVSCVDHQSTGLTTLGRSTAEERAVNSSRAVLPVAASMDDGLSPEEAAEFEQENEQLFEEMSSLVDEVRQIEGKVLEISRLQEVFTDRVLSQATEVDVIADLTVESSENVKDGNQEIREAIKNKASFRLWILLVILVCAFALLFLDWYS